MNLSASINGFVFVETVLYSAFFPEESIRFTKDAICQSSHNVIDIFYMNTTTTTDHFLKLLYSECAVPVLLNQLGKHIEIPEMDATPTTKVLLINTLSQLDTFMPFIYESRLGKDKRKYFVIIEQHDEPSPDHWLYYLFAAFWRKQVLNVVVLFHKNVVFHKESVQIYTYHLLEDGRNSNANNVSVPAISSNPPGQVYQEQEFNLNVMNVTSYPTSKWFFNKLTDLQRRKLVVSMISVPTRAYLREDKTSYTGIDGYVADLIRSRMNASFVYISPKISFNGSNNTGTFGDVVQKRAHFSFNVHAYAPYNFNNTVEQTNAFDHIKYCVIVPSNGVKPIAFNIFHSMTPTMWMLVIAAIIVVTVALATVQHIHKKISNVRERSYTTVELATVVLKSFLGDTIERIASNHSLRFILLGWLIYSFLLTNTFTATIISSLVQPNYRENINTIAELGASKLTILYPKSLTKNIKNGFDDDTFNLFEDNFKEIDSWEQHLTILNRNKTQYAYVLADYYCLYVVNSNIDTKTGESMFHMVPECLVSHPKVYLGQPGSMYLGYVNELLGRFHEFGMFRRWVAETKFFGLMQGLRMGNQSMDKQINYASVKVAMSMEYLQTPFYMLGLGLFVSAITFCLEKAWHKYAQQTQHKEGGWCFEEEVELEVE